jgi:hypothetical protein
VIRAHAGNKVPLIPHYSTVNRRVNQLDIKITEHVGNDIVIAALLHNSERSLLDDDFSNSQEWTKYELLSFD